VGKLFERRIVFWLFKKSRGKRERSLCVARHRRPAFRDSTVLLAMPTYQLIQNQETGRK
jgi:hypothetical protein